MKTRLVCLPLGELAPEMTVAAPVLSPHGGVLLAAGAQLDEQLLENLRRRGIEFVSVALPDARDPATIAAEQAAAAARVSHIFRGAGSATRQALQAVVAAYRQRQSA